MFCIFCYFLLFCQPPGNCQLFVNFSSIFLDICHCLSICCQSPENLSFFHSLEVCQFFSISEKFASLLGDWLTKSWPVSYLMDKEWQIFIGNGKKLSKIKKLTNLNFEIILPIVCQFPRYLSFFGVKSRQLPHPEKMRTKASVFSHLLACFLQG